jgi:hypothetical protein
VAADTFSLFSLSAALTDPRNYPAPRANLKP